MSDRIIPLLVISALLLLIDWYIFNAISEIRRNKAKKTNRFLNLIWWGYTALLILGVFASIFFNLILSVRAIILVAFFITFVTKVFFLPFLFLDDIRRGIVWVRRKARYSKYKSAPEQGLQSEGAEREQRAEHASLPERKEEEKISRSEFLVKAGIAVAAIPFASLTWGIVEGGYDYRIKRQTLYLPNLPKAFDGIKLGQISDIHSGSFYNRKAVLGGVEMLLKEKPDFIFFTGDLVNNIASEMKDYQDIFSKVKAPLGVFSVLGNHDYGDYYFGRDPSPAKAKNLAAIKSIHRTMGYDLLLNENRRLKVGGEEIAILGVENWGAGRFVRHGRLDLAVKGTDDAPVKLLMSHDPSHWRAQILNRPDIDVTFSGHTHGMQFGVRTKEYQWSPVQYIYKEWAGLYKEKTQQLYVNVGYGFLGYPGRVGILPEITIFELKRS